MSLYEMVKNFKRKYKFTIAFRIKQHCKVVEEFVNCDEKILYAFCGQKMDTLFCFYQSCVIVLTDKRILIAQKRMVFGYFYTTITPDMFNDLKISGGLFFGKIIIDSIKELVTISNISKKALDEIETNITTYMMEEKKKYSRPNC